MTGVECGASSCDSGSGVASFSGSGSGSGVFFADAFFLALVGLSGSETRTSVDVARVLRREGAIAGGGGAATSFDLERVCRVLLVVAADFGAAALRLPLAFAIVECVCGKCGAVCVVKEVVKVLFVGGRAFCL